jgi:hypothetical protein
VLLLPAFSHVRCEKGRGRQTGDDPTSNCPPDASNAADPGALARPDGLARHPATDRDTVDVGTSSTVPVCASSSDQFQACLEAALCWTDWVVREKVEDDPWHGSSQIKSVTHYSMYLPGGAQSRGGGGVEDRQHNTTQHTTTHADDPDEDAAIKLQSSAGPVQSSPVQSKQSKARRGKARQGKASKLPVP